MKDIADQFADDASETSSMDLACFKVINQDVIDELIEQKRFDDLLTVIFKQGFLSGMKFNSRMRDKILKW